jgi:hypothetical protein
MGADALPNFDDTEFLAAIQAKDELGLVVRAHIHIESELVLLLEALVRSKKNLDRLELEYGQRVYLAAALGMKEAVVRPLLAVGTIRNAFAHRLNSKLTEDRVNNFYKAFSSEQRSLIEESFRLTRQHSPSFAGKSVRQLPPREQFVLLASTARSLVQAERVALARGR